MRRPRPARRRPGAQDFLLEFTQVGRLVRVCAIDPVTGIEVTIAGPASAAQEDLTRAAVRKLQYVLRKRKQAPRRGGKGGLRV